MQVEVGAIFEGKVTGITKFGAFVEIEGGKTGMVHISEVASSFVKEIRDHVTEGQMVKVKVLSIGEDGKISLSIKKANEVKRENNFSRDRGPRPNYQQRQGRPGGHDYQQQPRSESANFDDMLSRFLQSSDEKMGDLKRPSEHGRRGVSSRRNVNDR
ncbi:MAG: S1 RNA-binding domain-containing protein [Oscillospiraceae bacterium]|nr:S1 RNA-binding domain-containing protein [Oscillospiraceae bacterium]